MSEKIKDISRIRFFFTGMFYIILIGLVEIKKWYYYRKLNHATNHAVK